MRFLMMLSVECSLPDDAERGAVFFLMILNVEQCFSDDAEREKNGKSAL